MSEIDTKYAQLGGTNGFLGAAAGPEQDIAATATLPAAKVRHYANGDIYWTKANGAHEVHGAILDKWKTDGLKDTIGYPTSDQTFAADGAGHYSEFASGVIVWSKKPGAHPVTGMIRDKWTALGGVESVLGYPLTDGKKVGDAPRFSDFENGTIYVVGNNSFALSGSIFKQWKDQGRDSGPLGLPISDVILDGASGQRVAYFPDGKQLTAPNVPAPIKIPKGGTTCEVLKDRTLPQITSDHNARAKDFRILSLSIYGPATKPLFACVWTKDPGPEQAVQFFGSDSEFQQFLGDQIDGGFVPTIISVTGPTKGARFALVCEKRAGLVPLIRHRLSGGSGDQDREAFGYWCRWARRNHHILRSAAIYGDDNDPRYAGIWEFNGDHTPWNVAYHTPDNALACNFMANSAGAFGQQDLNQIAKAQHFWGRTAFAGAPAARQIEIFRADPVGGSNQRIDTDAAQLDADIINFKFAKLVPTVVSGTIDKAGKSRFSAVYAGRTRPQDRTLEITGEAAASLAALDDVMSTLVEKSRVGAGSLAVARNGKLVYARAVSRVAPGGTAVKATDIFRMGSCSKPITATLVYQLAEEKKNGVPLLTVATDKLTDKATFALPGNTAFADKFKDITVLQLLAHQAGLTRDLPDETTIRDKFNAALPDSRKKHFPLSTKDLASYMATIPLAFASGTSNYSNVGYLLLMHLLAEMRGEAYEKAAQKHIFDKIGVTRARITASATTDQPANAVMAFDNDMRVGRNVLKDDGPISPMEYGTMNFAARGGYDGWSMAPADYVRFFLRLHEGETLLKTATLTGALGNGVALKSHGGAVAGAVAAVAHLNAEFTYAVFFNGGMPGGWSGVIEDVILALKPAAWPGAGVDHFATLGIT